MARQPITQRFAGEHCFRATVWSPTADAMGHTSVSVEGGTHPEVAELMQALMICGRRMSTRARSSAKKLTDEIRLASRED